MDTPVTSEGSRSGVNWIRHTVQSMLRARVLASRVLPTPGTSSNEEVALGQQDRQRQLCSIGFAVNDRLMEPRMRCWRRGTAPRPWHAAWVRVGVRPVQRVVGDGL